MEEKQDDTENLNERDESEDNETCNVIGNENIFGNVEMDTGSVINFDCTNYEKCNSSFPPTGNSHLSEDSNLDITDGISNLHIVELPDILDLSDKSEADRNEERFKCCSESKKVCWMVDEMPFDGDLKNTKLSICSENDDSMCVCDKGDQNLTICPKCFLLQNMSSGKLCFCDKTEVNGSICPNCHPLEEDVSLGSICVCEKMDFNESICGNCFLIRENVALGSKRKPQEACYGLHMQMNESKELLEESTTWLSDSYCLIKKPKIPIDYFNSVLEIDEIKNGNEVFNDIQFLDLDGDKKLDELDTTNAMSPCSFDSLPMELKLKIFSYFTQRELCRYIAPVCSSWFQLSKDISFWQQLDTTHEYDDVSSELLVRVIVSWCKHVTKLELNRRCTITITEFREIFQNCPNIQCLSLAFCTQIDNDILSLIGTYCKCLKSINLEGCNNVNDNSFYNFIGLPLTSVSVSHCNMLSDDGGIFLVRNFKNLVEINFDGIQWMSEDFTKSLVNNHYETLEKVFLDGENLGDDVVRQLSRCKQLRALSFSFCNLMTHHTVVWVGHCPKINHLQLRKGSNFTNASLLNYLKNMSLNQGLHFRYLNLAECSEMSDKCLFYLSERCPNLHTLDLSWCWEVSDDGLAHIIDNCQKLKELFLKGLHELYGTPFFHLPKSIPNLSFLDLSQCNKIQDQLIKYMVEKMQDLIVYNYYGEIVMNTRHREAHRYIDK